MVTRFAQLIACVNRLKALPQARPTAILLSLVMLTTSVDYAAAADEQKPGHIAEFVSAGPAAALTMDAKGRIAPKPQDDALTADLAAGVAKSLTEGQAKGYLRVGRDFSVTLTEKGRIFAESTIEQVTAGCDRVLSTTADWLGLHLELESTCTEEEFRSRSGFDVVLDETTMGPSQIAASGLAPPAPARDAANATSSEQFGCLIGLGALVVAFSLIAIAVASPATSWLIFWLTWTRNGATLFTAAITIVQNCTQVLAAQNRVGTTVYVCGRSYYAYYRWSNVAGRYIPTYVSYVCP